MLEGGVYLIHDKLIPTYISPGYAAYKPGTDFAWLIYANVISSFRHRLKTQLKISVELSWFFSIYPANLLHFRTVKD